MSNRPQSNVAGLKANKGNIIHCSFDPTDNNEHPEDPTVSKINADTWLWTRSNVDGSGTDAYFLKSVVHEPANDGVDPYPAFDRKISNVTAVFPHIITVDGAPHDSVCYRAGIEFPNRFSVNGGIRDTPRAELCIMNKAPNIAYYYEGDPFSYDNVYMTKLKCSMETGDPSGIQSEFEAAFPRKPSGATVPFNIKKTFRCADNKEEHRMDFWAQTTGGLLAIDLGEYISTDINPSEHSWLDIRNYEPRTYGRTVEMIATTCYNVDTGIMVQDARQREVRYYSEVCLPNRGSRSIGYYFSDPHQRQPSQWKCAYISH